MTGLESESDIEESAVRTNDDPDEITLETHIIFKHAMIDARVQSEVFDKSVSYATLLAHYPTTTSSPSDRYCSW
jgi:hypothetical protein